MPLFILKPDLREALCLIKFSPEWSFSLEKKNILKIITS